MSPYPNNYCLYPFFLSPLALSPTGRGQSQAILAPCLTPLWESLNEWMDGGGRDDSGESLLVLPSALCKAQCGVLPFMGDGLGLPWHRSLETLNP